MIGLQCSELSNAPHMFGKIVYYNDSTETKEHTEHLKKKAFAYSDFPISVLLYMLFILLRFQFKSDLTMNKKDHFFASP